MICSPLQGKQDENGAATYSDGSCSPGVPMFNFADRTRDSCTLQLAIARLEFLQFG